MQDFDMSGVPGEELSSIPGEERLKNFMELIQAQKGEEWQSRLSDILDSFEDFLTIRPEPPQSWQDTYAASGKQFPLHRQLEVHQAGWTPYCVLQWQPPRKDDDTPRRRNGHLSRSNSCEGA